MPLDDEFRHHLHELMVETSLALREKLAAHKRQLVWNARQTHNSAAIPIAYSEASIHAFRTRVRATITKYLDALEVCSIKVDASVENEMLQLIGALTSAAPSLTFPPGITSSNAGAVQRAHKMEMARAGSALYREAANRLREAKMRAQQGSRDIGSLPMPSPSQSFTIASVAKTLAELKALPIIDQTMLLLRRLAHIAPQGQSVGGLNKGNLLLPNDPYGLAAGFPASENMAVRQHLLGAPWTRLVNEGFLVDPSGSGFFSLSEDGFSAAKAAADFKASAPTDTPHPDGNARPTVFVSYSWDSPEHKKWVLRLAERLRVEGGVKVILDRWHLPLGGDRTLFMEQSIRDSDFVLVVCTSTDSNKANNRDGGVGYEAMIITNQLAQQIRQNKFIPVLRSGEWDSSLPIWIQSKIGLDLRGDTYAAEEYDLLVRTLHHEREQLHRATQTQARGKVRRGKSMAEPR
jgi:hypothetical protein